jgi:divalent metal cation (Fe/Co/Zn/Cd) transporter
MRRTGGEWFSDIVIQVDASLSMEASHRVTEGVEKSLADLMPGGDVVVHVEPVLPGPESATSGGDRGRSDQKDPPERADPDR